MWISARLLPGMSVKGRHSTSAGDTTMKARDIMTPSPCCGSLSDSIQDIARLMRDNDCGSVPIVEDGCVVGIVTDRDLAVRALAKGQGATTLVRDVMTASPCCCSADDEMRDVERLMADKQIRRVPVVDADGCCMGIIAQADLARAALGERVSEHEVAVVVERISVPRADSPRRDSADRPEYRL
jgi:CBS domain-containing protein